jgi:Sec-independent protein translocase protein TatA
VSRRVQGNAHLAERPEATVLRVFRADLRVHRWRRGKWRSSRSAQQGMIQIHHTSLMAPRRKNQENNSTARPIVESRRELQIALIPALAGLLGALIGGFSTYLVTVHAENERRSEQHRNERREAYSKFYADAAAFSAEISLRADIIYDTGAEDPERREELNRLRSDLDERARILAQYQALVVLLGPKDVQEAGFNLISTISKMREQVSENLLNFEKLSASTTQVADSLNLFAETARADLRKDD